MNVFLHDMLLRTRKDNFTTLNMFDYELLKAQPIKRLKQEWPKKEKNVK